MSYYIYKGLIPEDMFVCHSCDNPWCVNPDHLWLGTAKDNAADAKAKGRAYIKKLKPPKVFTPRYNHAARKLSRDQVLEILTLNRDKGFGSKRLAKIYGVNLGTMKSLLRRESYKDVSLAHLEELKP